MDILKILGALIDAIRALIKRDKDNKREERHEEINNSPRDSFKSKFLRDTKESEDSVSSSETTVERDNRDS